ncbi:DNA gyrase subunit A [Leptotrichia sp. oral taxon 221]|jgi:DNA gyrase, A subunit|uniref:DNA gyrase subunit A n=1 Tax=Leptotrichia sp. oral taxon 221 TaxID=712362 RepID=UPI001B8CCACA|nr:DNA gyrase subunit A [Leptotrichia sp. oral taxon 221]QUB97186.1 DNA gyrase subunit A [Leptotrichia sp. oral taxon 221]
MSDDFRDEDKKENEEINENDDKEIIVDGLPKTTDLSNEQNVYIEDEIKSAYLDYSMSVIVSRALPDVRDGLKPVHRRILFAMNEMGMSHKTPFKKSARIVGDVLGKFHPHGDSSVYGAMVRMAQDFNMRYELIDGHGNFGSIDGDEAAAMRYTEARMAKITEELLADIGKDTIDYRKNFDESLDEPVVLPAKLPNLLLNGANGIAVGMATNIPPHNLGEVVDGIVALIDNPEISIDELIGYIKGPDFPTGGIINGRQGIYDAYRTGRGRLIVAGRVEIEKAKNGKESIIVTELPYQVNKSRFIERIANLVKQKRLTGISDLRDETDRDGIRIVIELKKGEESELVLNNLYKFTDLQNTFGVIMLALVNNAPKVLNLKQILEKYLEHRYEVITRRVKFELNKAKNRAHILEGFKIALDNIEEVIRIIRAAKDANIAKANLIEAFSFSEIQAKAILDMRLQRLTGLERDKINEEYNELMLLIEELNAILADDSKIYGIIKEEAIKLKEDFGDDRKTEIRNTRAEITIEDLIKDEEVVVTLTEKGYVKRIPIDSYRSQRRGGVGVNATNTIEDDVVKDMYIAKNLDTLLIFTTKGKVFSIKVYEIPETGKQARGKLIGNIIKLSEDESVSTVIKVREFEKDRNLFFVTRNGVVKKSELTLFGNINKNGKRAIRLNDDDEVMYIGLTSGTGEDEIFAATRNGIAMRFSEKEVRSMGTAAAGVKGITLRDEDKVVGAAIINSQMDNAEVRILTITEEGYGKRTKLLEYRLTSRGGKGIINAKLNEKTGKIVDVKVVNENDEIMLITSEGTLIRTSVNNISVIGRTATGVRIMKVRNNEKIASVVKITEEPKLDEDEQE